MIFAVLAAIDPVLGIILGAAISGAGAYFLAAKKMSGEIKTSDAEQLWTESRSIREWSADRIAQLTGIITALETRVNAVEETNKSLSGENEKLLDRIVVLTDTISDLREELIACRMSIESLSKKLVISQDRVDVLEDEADTPAGDRRKEDEK